ncbi:MAG: hypothetical protein JNL38_41555 [Myxococcales bacterium]|nr:hypothetical protein [Myxococcales bacterium]
MKKLSCALVAAAALALGGCGSEYSTHTIDDVATPAGGSVSQQAIRVPYGAAVKAHIMAYDDDGHRLGGDVQSSDPTVVDVANLVTGDDDWVFFGRRAGHAEIRLYANGRLQRTIPADVVSD